MGKSEDQSELLKEMESLNADLSSIDLEVTSDQEDLHQYLDKVSKLQISIDTYKERHGENDWISWGPPRQVKILTLAHSIKSRINQLDRNEIASSKSFTKTMAILSALFAALSAIAALYSIFGSSGSGP